MTGVALGHAVIAFFLGRALFEMSDSIAASKRQDAVLTLSIYVGFLAILIAARTFILRRPVTAVAFAWIGFLALLLVEWLIDPSHLLRMKFMKIMTFGTLGYALWASRGAGVGTGQTLAEEAS